MNRGQKRSHRNSSQIQSQNLSQTNNKQLSQVTQNQINLDEKINECVRYFIYKSGLNSIIRKTDIQKKVLPGVGRHLDHILKGAEKILKDVYGLQLLSFDSKKCFILKNTISYNYLECNSENSTYDKGKILLLLILTHIFMSNNCVSDGSLYCFLENLNIDPKQKHPIFGDIEHYINHELIKEKYLIVDNDVLSKKSTFSWGPRAEIEISKNQILQFVCDILKKSKPRDWIDQYEAAQQQINNNNHFNNETNDEEES